MIRRFAIHPFAWIRRLPPASPWIAAGLALITFLLWLRPPITQPFPVRVPGADRPAPVASTSDAPAPEDVFAAGRLILGPGKPSPLPGQWPCFRGPRLDGVSRDAVALASSWPPSGPRALWSIEVGEGYAGPIIDRGRIYLMDYDRENQRDALRCLSLDDGAEIWRFAYPINVKRNHGITRTVPALASNIVVAMGPKCHVLAVHADSGNFLWGLDLVRDYAATIPPWYTGQCPLILGSTVYLAPGGPEALLLAVDLPTGRKLWTTPNPNDWKMTHASLLPLELGGRTYLVYCASGGVVLVDAETGVTAWESTRWKINIATVPTPVDLGDGRVFFTGGYGAGSLLLQFRSETNAVSAEELWKVKPVVFGATQHSPIAHRDHLFGIRADGRFVCLSTNGTVTWTSPPDTTFGLGPQLLAGDLFLALNDSGRLTLFRADLEAFQPLAQAQILEGHEAWAPFALAGGRLLVRDLTRMVCLDLANP